MCALDHLVRHGLEYILQPELTSIVVILQPELIEASLSVTVRNSIAQAPLVEEPLTKVDHRVPVPTLVGCICDRRRLRLGASWR